MLVCRFRYLFCTRDGGCSAHPAFPAPSCLGDNETQSSGASRREIEYAYLLFEIRIEFRLVSNDRPYSGAALSPRELDNFAAKEAAVMTTAIKAITSVQMALISGFTPNRTSE
jgi:hypothetical protein